MASKTLIMPVRQCLHAARQVNRCQTFARAQQHLNRPFSVAANLRIKQYTKDHEWIEISSDKKTATLGITSYAANALGDVVYVELPELSLNISAGDSIGAVESVKSASDIMTPVSGTVVKRNDTLEDKPKLLNEDPEGEGWFAEIELGESVESETSNLLDEAGYKKFTEEAS